MFDDFDFDNIRKNIYKLKENNYNQNLKIIDLNNKIIKQQKEIEYLNKNIKIYKEQEEIFKKDREDRSALMEKILKQKNAALKIQEDGTIVIPENSENFKIILKEIAKEIIKDNYVSELILKLEEAEAEIAKYKGENDVEKDKKSTTEEEVFQLFENMWEDTIKNSKLNKKVPNDIINNLRKENYTGKFKLGCICSINNPNHPPVWRVVGGNNDSVILQHIALSAKERVEKIENVYPSVDPDGKDEFLNPNYKESGNAPIIY